MQITGHRPRFTLATAADAGFIYSLIEMTMRSYVEQVWGHFSEDRNRTHVSEAIAAGHYSIIALEHIRVGALCVERHPSHIQLSQLFILPEHQRQGIGTSIVRGLINEARESKKPLRLRVLSVNPARRLYEREGFHVTSTTPERVYMELHA
jgi:GNAT superfamily N-acetyltransferase